MTTRTLRIASYNLQKCVGLDLRRRPGRSLSVIEALRADIVVLQEADKRLPPRPAALPHGLIEAAGWRIVEFGAPEGSLGWHGNAMLVRGDVSVRATHAMDLPGLEPRGAILADLDTSIGPLRLIGVHLGLIGRYRLMQVAAIRHRLERLAPCPTVIAGDFNDWSRGRALDVALGPLDFTASPPSFPAPRPVARLDRFVLSADLSASATGVHNRAPARVASDHLPVWIDLAQAKAGEARR